MSSVRWFRMDKFGFTFNLNIQNNEKTDDMLGFSSLATASS